MNTRKKDRLDYKIFHETGRKVVILREKMSSESKMDNSPAPDPEVMSEMKIRGDIKHALEIYAIEDLLSWDEISEGLGVISELAQQFRHVHVDLRVKLGQEYESQYPSYDEIINNLTLFVKSAKAKLRTVKQEEESRIEIRMKEKEKEALKAEEEILNQKINQLKNMVDVSLVENVFELDDYISKMEGFIEEYFKLGGKLKFCFGDQYNDLCDPNLKLCTIQLREDVKLAKNVRKKIVDIEEETKKQGFEEMTLSVNIKGAENLFSEIELRCKTLLTKYEVNLDDLSDYQILEIDQNKYLDTEFNEVVEKVTSLAALAPGGGETAQKLLRDAIVKRDELVEKRDKFVKNLSAVVIERDITPDKMKNASGLKIELPKFSGYDCAMDFYTFRSQFQKLVEPAVQKKYWADYLKRNYLGGSALLLVEKETEYSKIWEKLLESFGNARFLLQNQLSALDKVGGLWKIKGDEKVSNAIASLINVMSDLKALAVEHNIEGQLYEGGGLEKILILIGEGRHRKFISQNLCPANSKKEEWEKLLLFLKQELQVREKISINKRTAQLMGLCAIKNEAQKGDSSKTNRVDGTKKWSTANHLTADESLKCHVCGRDDHTFVTTTKGKKIIPYYVCEQFVKMSPTERLSTLQSKHLCTGCIYPGAVKGPKHRCFFTNYCCPHVSHDSEKLHILLCEVHKKDGANIKLLEKFKMKFIDNCKSTLPPCSKQLACFSEMVGVATCAGEQNSSDTPRLMSDVIESAVFQLQTIEVEGISLNLFFDTGCSEMVVRKSAVQKLEGIGRAKQVIPGPLVITGVGDQKSVCEEGVFSIRLPLYDGNNAVLSGLSMPKITTEFPLYNLGNVERDIRNECRKIGGESLVSRLPKLPSKVGGQTDILMGIKYAKYFPKKVFEFETGLGIYESVFKSRCGSRGVVSGPHKEFSKIEKNAKGLHVNGFVYLQPPVDEFNKIWKLQYEIPLLGVKMPTVCNVDAPVCQSELTDYKMSEIECYLDGMGCIAQSDGPKPAFVSKRSPKCVKQFDKIEKAGTEVSYRCIDCRSCPKCKNGATFEAISIQEEIEQGLIERSIHVDISQGITIAKLPFLVDPDVRLKPNEQEAIKVFRGQVKKLNSSPEDKIAVVESESKLQALGFVDYVDNLNDDDKALILSSAVKYFIPWRAVWNAKSVSTPCRLVFDGSQGTKEGCGINSLLAKGTNSLNKLVEILIRWTVYQYAFHTDIQKMYNTVRLDKRYWRYQLYLWCEELKGNDTPKWKVIKTLIYGIRSSGNLAECGLRRTVDMCKAEFPKAFDVITNDTYMDDTLSGTQSHAQAMQVTDELEIAVGKGGFRVKGFTISGYDPPEVLSNSKEYVVVAGLKWFPKGDFVKLNIDDLNFNKKLRGRKSGAGAGVIPEVLTKRACVSKVSEIFDPLGKVAPILGGMKLDVSVLHQRTLDWDDPIPAELRNIWLANFNLINEMREIRFNRAVVPIDAINMDIETIDTADAGEKLVCAAIYARFKRRSGGYSCQLIFSRSKIVHDITIPRAELVAAVLNASTGHIVRRSLQKFHKRAWKVTDSQVALHWINCTNSALKMWVRNRVVEIRRLSEPSEWYYVKSENMIADLGTRKGANIEDIGPDSVWNRGLPWMRDEESNFPLKSVDDIVLSTREKADANKERILEENIDSPFCNTGTYSMTKYVPSEVGERFKFSNYIINPTKYRFRTVVRILGLVFLFIEKINNKCKGNRHFDFLKKRQFSQHTLNQGNGEYCVSPVNISSHATGKPKVAVIYLSEDILRTARCYFFRKATLEVQHFVDKKKYERHSVWKDEILYFTGRILPMQEIEGKLNLSDVSLDLAGSTFCVPIIDARSPIAYAIVTETHWYDPDVSHGGVESVLRYCQKTAYIIGGRELVKSIKKECAKCRILHKKGVRVAMGPVGENNLKVAPPFYCSQVDICGPFNAYSPVNKRVTLKIWLVIFCCSVTGAVDSRVMENYTTDSFMSAFVRFACRFGYPKIIMPDEGSQLVKGCQDMILSFSDIWHKMNVEYGVDFKTCPVGAHYVHGKVERKIRDIKLSIVKNVGKSRLSVLQWETLGQLISNSINNMPIGLGSKSELLENLDILTPNRLILGRNNNRNPTAPLEISHDFRKIIESNNKIFDSWFKQWLISYVPTLVEKPKWFFTERNICVGDIVLFLKSEREFDRQYQYGIVVKTIVGRDGLIRVAEVEYQNHNEKLKRVTRRGVRDLVVIHPIDEIGISKEIDELANM